MIGVEFVAIVGVVISTEDLLDLLRLLGIRIAVHKVGHKCKTGGKHVVSGWVILKLGIPLLGASTGTIYTFWLPWRRS